MRRKRRLLFYVPIAIAALSIVSLLLFTFLFDLNNYKDFFAKKMEAVLHRPVSIGKVEADIYKGFQVRFTDFTIGGEKGLPYLLKADYLDFRFHPLSLLKKQLFISRLELGSPTFFLARRATGGDGGFPLADAVDNSKVELLIRDFYVYKGRFMVAEGALDDGSPPLELEDVTLQVKDLLWIDPPLMLFTGLLSKGHEGGHSVGVNLKLEFKKHPMKTPLREVPFSAEVKLSGLNLNDYYHYFSNGHPLNSVAATLDADLALEGSAVEGVNVEGSVGFQSLQIRIPAWNDHTLSTRNASAQFNMFADGSSLRFDDLSITWDDIRLKGRLTLADYRSQDMTVSAEFDSTPFEFSGIKGYLPPSGFPPTVERFIDGVTRARVELSGVQIRGGVQQLKNWRSAGSGAVVKGSVALTDMNLMMGEDGLSLQGMDALLSLDGDTLDFAVTGGRYKNSTIGVAAGKVTGLFGERKLALDVTASVDLADIHELVSARDDRGVPGFIGRLESLHGKGDLRLHVVRRLEEGPTVLEGEIQLSETFISHPSFPLPLVDVEGRVRITDRAFGFEDLAGVLGSSPFRITLEDYYFREEAPLILLWGDIELHHGDLAALLPAKAADKMGLAGSTDATFRLTGTKRGMDIYSDFDFKGFSYGYNNFIKPLPAEGSLSVEARLVPSRALTVKKLSLSHGDMKVSSYGKVVDFSDPVLDFQLVSEDFNIKYMAEFFPRLLPYNLRGGRSSVQFRFTGKPSNLKASGTIVVKDVAADFPPLVKPVYLTSGKITYGDGVFNWEAGNVSLGRTKFFTRGRYGGNSQKKLSMDFKFSSLYLEDFSGRGNGEERVEEGSDTRTDGSRPRTGDSAPGENGRSGGEGIIHYPFSAGITAENLFIKRVKLSDISTRLESGRGLWRFNNLMFSVADGKFKGDLVINGLSRSGSQFEMRADAAGLKVEKLIRQIHPRTEIITGTLGLKGTIRGDKFDLEGIRKSISGKLSVRVDDGIVKKFKVLSAIFGFLSPVSSFLSSPISSILNLPKAILSVGREPFGQGLPFHSIEGDLTFDKGIMSTDNLLLDGPLARLSSVGSVDFAAKKYDVSVAFQPFGEVDDLVSKIPLLGKLLLGGEEDISIEFFTLSGKFGEKNEGDDSAKESAEELPSDFWYYTLGTE